MTQSATESMPDEISAPSFVIQRLIDNGWKYVPGHSLDRDETDVVLNGSLRAAIERISGGDAQEAVDKFLKTIGNAILSGLIGYNQTISQWMHTGVPTPSGGHVSVIDHENMDNNEFIVSDDVVFRNRKGGISEFDVVLWINGLPVVVGETKDDDGALWVDALGQGESWVHAAEAVRAHEEESPEFFATNIVSFAVGRPEGELSGMEFHFGAIRTSVEKWELWGSTNDPFNLDGQERVERSVELLLGQERLLSIIRDFTLYGKNKDGARAKITPRYPQVEAVEAIYKRAMEPGGKQGLIVQHQGTGKTLAMVFATIKLTKEPEMNNPTIYVIADRTDLVEQTHRQFEDVGIKNVYKPDKKPALASLVKDTKQKIVITTIHKFGKLNTVNQSSNIIVLIDEAHRTQEGTLGTDLRKALPNARFFGFTGTPVVGKERNTFALFGDPNDDGWVINEYLQERSIADGTVVRIHVDSRAVQYHLSSAVIDAEFQKMVAEESIDAGQSEKVIEATVLKALTTSPERIRGVCETIVEHYYERVAPNGMKAQVVAPDRAMCVAYDREIKRILNEMGSLDETAVVMSYTADDKAKNWDEYSLTSKQVTGVVNDFNNFHHPLKFLIVTNMLTTGFDAPIEGVMYLDRRLQKHTLFQTMSRVNRKWKHPETHWRKPYGMVVDFVGLGQSIAHAFAPVNPDSVVDGFNSTVEDAYSEFNRIFYTCLSYFDGIDIDPDSGMSVAEGCSVVTDSSELLQVFVHKMGKASDLWESIYPDAKLDDLVSTFTWMVAVYRESLSHNAANKELLHRLGAKTLALIHANIEDVLVEQLTREMAVLDAEAIAKLREYGVTLADNDSQDNNPEEDDAEPDVEIDLDGLSSGKRGLTFQYAKHTVARKIERVSLPGDDLSPYLSIGERLQAMYEDYLAQTVDAARMLKEILNAARDVAEIDESLREFEAQREFSLPTMLKNLIGDMGATATKRMVAEVNGMVDYFSENSESFGASDVEREVAALMKRLKIDTGKTWTISILGGYVLEACRATKFKESESNTAAQLIDLLNVRQYD